MPWFAVGTFDGKTVRIDKQALRAQAENATNDRLSLCPIFSTDAVLKRIDQLPEVLDPAADKRWVTVYSRDTGKPVWALPQRYMFLPHDLMHAHRKETGTSIGRSASPSVVLQ
jgi:hypothetical protein